MSIENKIFCHQQQTLRDENITFLPRYNKLPFWEIFVTFIFSVVLLVVQVKLQNHSDIEFSGRP